MKKFMSAVLIAAMLGTLAGCGTSKDQAEATTESADEYVDVDIDAGKYVELGQYKGLTVTAATVEVTDEEVEEQLDNLKYDYAEYEKVTDRKEVKDDDLINVDYVCTVDGETVEDYTESDLDIQIGGGELIFGDDFDVESALVGHKVGEKVTVKGTFSDDEIYEELAGKEGQFDVTINYIEKEVYPEINDAFIKENFDYDTVDEYKEVIKKDLEDEAETEADEENQSAIWELVVKNSKQIEDFPEDALEAEKHNVVLSERENASYFGLDMGTTDEEINDFFTENYDMTLDEYTKDSLFRQCVLDLIVEKEGIAPSDEDIDKLIEEEKEAGGYESEEEVLEYSSREDFESQYIYEKVMDILTKENTIEPAKSSK